MFANSILKSGCRLRAALIGSGPKQCILKLRSISISGNRFVKQLLTMTPSPSIKANTNELSPCELLVDA